MSLFLSAQGCQHSHSVRGQPQNQADPDSSPGHATQCVTFANFLKLSSPQFPQYLNQENSFYQPGGVLGYNETMYVSLLSRGTCIKCLVSENY